MDFSSLSWERFSLVTSSIKSDDKRQLKYYITYKRVYKYKTVQIHESARLALVGLQKYKYDEVYKYRLTHQDTKIKLSQNITFQQTNWALTILKSNENI